MVMVVNNVQGGPALDLGGGAEWRGNEPAGMTLIDERPFNAIDEREPGIPYWWFMEDGSIETDATAPHSPSNVLRGFVAQGSGAGGLLQAVIEGQGISFKTFYICYWLKFSANWWGHLTGVTKINYWAANGSGGQCFIEAHGVGSAPLACQMVLQAGESTDGTFPSNLNPDARIVRDQWSLIEATLVGNTLNQADGTFDWYLDGEHIGSVGGLKIGTAGAAALFDRFVYILYWGGSGDTVPEDMWADLDAVYLSGKN